MSLERTAAQTIGPFFHDALMRHAVDDLDPDAVAGTRIEVHGRVTDGAGAPVTDALLELWQADGAGRYRHPLDGRPSDVPDSFLGFGRIASDAHGNYRFSTVMPGTVPGPAGTVQAPHLSLQVFARGLLKHLWTRVYFPQQPANDADPVLARVPADRRHTLIAAADGGPAGCAPPTCFRFDIVLQGERETVFLSTP